MSEFPFSWPLFFAFFIMELLRVSFRTCFLSRRMSFFFFSYYFSFQTIGDYEWEGKGRVEFSQIAGQDANITGCCVFLFLVVVMMIVCWRDVMT
jgi:hypothetical protein